MEIQGYAVVGDDHRVDPNLDGFGTGYESRDYDEFPMNGLEFAAARDIPSFSQNEILDLIAEKTAKKTWVRDKCDAVGSKVKNQSSSSYCWGHAPVRGMEVDYVLQGGVVKVLSAFYLCSTIKNGRNQGGSGIVAAKFAHERGTCLESMHAPMNFKVNTSAEAKENAALHQITAWEDLDPSDKLAIWTRIVLDMPVTVGIPSWTHEVLLTFLVNDNGTIREGFDNSWGTSWGTNGRGVLTGSKQRFSEAGSIISVEPARN